MASGRRRGLNSSRGKGGKKLTESNWEKEEKPVWKKKESVNLVFSLGG